VGVADETAVQGTADEFEGRIVEEGYDDGTTTFNRGNTNFLAVGRAYRPGKQNGDAVNAYDEPVRIVVFGEVKED